jgi:hypothetical protein
VIKTTLTSALARRSRTGCTEVYCIGLTGALMPLDLKTAPPTIGLSKSSRYEGWLPQAVNYSCRNATSGSITVAWRAGMKQATAATVINTSDTAAKVKASVGLVA